MRSFSSDEHTDEKLEPIARGFQNLGSSLLNGYFILLGGSSPFAPLGIYINVQAMDDEDSDHILCCSQAVGDLGRQFIHRMASLQEKQTS